MSIQFYIRYYQVMTLVFVCLAAASAISFAGVHAEYGLNNRMVYMIIFMACVPVCLLAAGVCATLLSDYQRLARVPYIRHAFIRNATRQRLYPTTTQ